MEEFNNVFGGQSASFFGPGIVKSIFDEAGNAPVTMYLARVVGSGSVVASGTGSLSGDATMTVKAGYKGKEDPTPIPIFVTLRFSFSKDFFRDEFNKQDSSYFLFSNKYKESVFKDNVFQ